MESGILGIVRFVFKRTVKTYLDTVPTQIREPEWPLEQSLGFCVFHSSVMWVEVHPSPNMSSVFYCDAYMIKNTCILDTSCQRRWRVFELGEVKVQMIYKQALKNLYGLWLFPACIWGIGGRRRSGNVWIVFMCSVSLVRVMYLLHVSLGIHLAFLYEKCAVDTRPWFCVKMLSNADLL